MEPTPNSENKTRLEGVSVLVVEDDYLVAQEMAACLRRYGATVLGPAPDVTRSRTLLRAGDPDCALLDVNLKGQFVYELADELIDRGVPAIFTTGYDSQFLPPRLRSSPCLQKPVDVRELVRKIRDHAHVRRSSTAQKPL